MKNRALIAAVCLTTIVAVSSVRNVKADPLTLIAIAGVTAVLVASSADMIENDHPEDSKTVHAGGDGPDTSRNDSRSVVSETEAPKDHLLILSKASEEANRR